MPTACPHCPESLPADQMRENGVRARVDDGGAVGVLEILAFAFRIRKFQQAIIDIICPHFQCDFVPVLKKAIKLHPVEW